VALADGAQLTADAVVVATAGLLDEPAHGWHGVSTLYYDAPVPPFPGPWLVLDGESDGPVNEIVTMSEVSPDLAPPGRSLISVSVLGGDRPDRDAVEAQLRGWFGKEALRWRHLRTYTIPAAVPAWPAATEIEKDPRLLPGLYACGDHREHPSLNGALASGRKAAEAVLSAAA
jgi:Flavin containing amine oxidoreductase